MFSPIAIAIVTVLMVPSPSSSHAHPVHELHVTATRLAFEPSIIRILAGEPVRLVICSGDAVHGVAMRDLNIDVQIPRGGATVIVEFTAPRAGRFQPMPEAVGPDVHLEHGRQALENRTAEEWVARQVPTHEPGRHPTAAGAHRRKVVCRDLF